MEVLAIDRFYDGHHVRLRSRVHGTYLKADKDGRGVSLSSRGDSMRAAWAVHRYGDAEHVLLHSAAYGRYLASSPAASAPHGCHGFRVELRDYDELDEDTIRWHPHNIGGPCIHLRHLARGRYRYLRAHLTFFNTLNADVVSADLIDNLSQFYRWVLERIPSTERVPRLPPPSRFRIVALLPSRVVELIGNGEGFYTNPVSFVFRGRSVFRLRTKVARRLGITSESNIPEDLVLYVRTGTHGRFTPLVVNLPRSSQTLVITVEPPPGNIVQRYPDFGA